MVHFGRCYARFLPRRYYLYLYIPPSGICDADGATSYPHTTVVETKAGPNADDDELDFAPADAPRFDSPANAEARGFTPLNVEHMEAFSTDAVDALLGRNSTSVRYTSNLNAATAAGPPAIPNDKAVLVGIFDVQTIVSLSVDDNGFCSSYAQKYMVRQLINHFGP